MAFPQDLFFLNIVIYSSEKKLSLLCYSLTRNWLFVNLSILAVTVSSDKVHREGNGQAYTIHVSLLWHLLSRQKGSKMEREEEQTHQESLIKGRKHTCRGRE